MLGPAGFLRKCSPSTDLAVRGRFYQWPGNGGWTQSFGQRSGGQPSTRQSCRVTGVLGAHGRRRARGSSGPRGQLSTQQMFVD